MANEVLNRVVEAPFRLTNKDAMLTEADGTADAWSDIWKYQVPNGSALVLKAHHTFAAYLEDGSAEVGSATCQIQIEKRDSSGSDTFIVYGPDLYIASKEFQDVDLKARLRIPGDGVVINEREFLVIMVKDDGAIDASDSYFELHIGKVRKALGI